MRVVKRFVRFLPYYHAEIRLVPMGCHNRPFFHIGVLPSTKPKERFPDEILGSFDPMLNERNEKLVSINLNRLAFWIGEGAKPTEEVSHLLGMIGFLPVDPVTYQKAREDRRKAEEDAKKKAEEEQQQSSNDSDQSNEQT